MSSNTTVLGIVNRALRLIGVAQTGESAGADESKDAFDVLNQLLGQWNNQKLMLYGWKNELFNLTAAKGVYTIGPGGDFDTTRPQKITKAFVRYNASTQQSFAYDYGLEIVPNDKYQDVFLKALTVTYPIYLFYNNTYPLGAITLYPYPSQECILGLSSWMQIEKFESLIQDISLPPGYESALAYNLAIEMGMEYGKPLDPMITEKALETKADIMRVNTEISYLKTDTALLPKRAFNILTSNFQ